MPEEERKELLEALEAVDGVVISYHTENPEDMSVCRELEALRPDIFANGGDRKKDNVPEVDVCKNIGCEMVFSVVKGGKIQSSSWLVDNVNKGK